MTRDEWKKTYSSLRYRLMRNPKITRIAVTITAAGRDFDIRVTRDHGLPSPYHAPIQGLRICRPTIIDRPTRQRWAEEMQVAQIDRDLARKSRRPLDRRAYRAAIDYARDLRLGNA